MEHEGQRNRDSNLTALRLSRCRFRHCRNRNKSALPEDLIKRPSDKATVDKKPDCFDEVLLCFFNGFSLRKDVQRGAAGNVKPAFLLDLERESHRKSSPDDFHCSSLKHALYTPFDMRVSSDILGASPRIQPPNILNEPPVDFVAFGLFSLIV